MSSKGFEQVISWHVCTVTAVLFVATRLALRLRLLGELRADDYLIGLAALCLAGDLAIQQYMWQRGMADPARASAADFVAMMQMIVPGSVLYVSSLWAVKVALVLLYKRVARPSSAVQTVCNAALAVLAATWAVVFFHIMFQCWPHDRRWSRDKDYQCSDYNSEVNYWITVIFNISTDIAILALPISLVASLQMKLKQKIGIGAIFMLGIFVVIGSVVRAYFSRRNETMLTCTVSMIETTIAIIAACLPPVLSAFTNTAAPKPKTSSSAPHTPHAVELSAPRRSPSASSKPGDSEDELVGDGWQRRGQTAATDSGGGGSSAVRTVSTRRTVA